MEKTRPIQSNGKIDMFYGFWKYLGITGTFLIGIVLFYWGAQILLNSWGDVRSQVGYLGHIIIAPLVAGATLTWLSFAEFLRIIRQD